LEDGGGDEGEGGEPDPEPPGLQIASSAGFFDSLGQEEHRRLPQQWRRRRGTVRTVRRASRM